MMAKKKVFDLLWDVFILLVGFWIGGRFIFQPDGVNNAEIVIMGVYWVILTIKETQSKYLDYLTDKNKSDES